MSDHSDLDGLSESQSRLRLAPAAGPRPRPAAAVDADYEMPGGREVHLVDYVKVLYKRRWLAGTAFVAVVVFSTVQTYTTIPLYQGRVQILIEKENTNVVTFKQAIEQNQSSDDYYQTQYKILQSRALARRTIEKLGLWNHVEFNPKPDTSPTLRSVLKAPLSAGLRLIRSTSPAKTGAAPSPPDETKHQSAIIDQFLAGLTIVPIRNSRLVDVKYTSTSPSFAAEVANAHARAFVEQTLEYKFLSSKEASDWLAVRLAEQRKQVDASEQAMQQYREQNDAVSLDDRQDIVVQKLGDLNAAVTRAKMDRMEKEAVYRQVQAIQADRAALDTFPAILSNAFVQGQKAELAALQRELTQKSGPNGLGDNHPEIVKLRSSIQMVEAKLQGEIGKVVQSVRNQYQAILAQETSLTEALNQQKLEALSVNRKGIEFGVLTREAASNRQIFESLMQRTKETGISGELKTNNIRIVDIAETPRGAFNLSTRNNLLLTLFGGALAGIGLAFFFEYLDNRIKLPEEVKRHLGLPFLGMIPALFDKGIENPLINTGVPPSFLESFRALRTNLLFSSAEAGSRSIVVTSTGPGEGKTLVASNLAVAIAQAGPRVLLIDADMRKPRVHSLFERAQEPGLSNVLVGTAKASDSVHRTAVSGLWLMTAGTHPPNAAELLGSKRFHELLVSLAQHFDWVIIDTPPVMAVTDASVAAHAVTGVLFVVGSQLTSRHTAQRAIEQLRHARANIFGAVLNRVDLQHHAYYYSTYYRRDYADYYQKPSTSVRTGT